jgi:hypothetical protein
MHIIKLHLLSFFIAFTLQSLIVAAEKDQNAEKKQIGNFCFNASLEGTYSWRENRQTFVHRPWSWLYSDACFFQTSWCCLNFIGYRLNVTVLTTKVVHDWLACVIECYNEPCCRSINYKNTLNLQNEPNCEMLHNVVYNMSQKYLERNCSYNHVFLNNPQKVKIILNCTLTNFKLSNPRYRPMQSLAWGTCRYSARGECLRVVGLCPKGEFGVLRSSEMSLI